MGTNQGVFDGHLSSEVWVESGFLRHALRDSWDACRHQLMCSSYSVSDSPVRTIVQSIFRSPSSLGRISGDYVALGQVLAGLGRRQGPLVRIICCQEPGNSVGSIFRQAPDRCFAPSHVWGQNHHFQRFLSSSSPAASS